MREETQEAPILPSGDPEKEGFSQKALSRIRPALQEFIDKKRFPGFSALIARRGRVVYFDQTGFSDPELLTPMSRDTIFRVYSMTKPVVCAAFMMLFDEGRFSLDDPVSRYIPAFGKLRVLTGKRRSEAQLVDTIRPVAIRDLLTHTSGLTYGFLDDTPVNGMYRASAILSSADYSLEEMVAEAARLPLAFQPGERWSYGISIDVAAHLIELLSGKPLREFLADRLFLPLGMEDTGFSVPPQKRPRLAAMFGNPDISVTPLKESFRSWRKGFFQRIDVEPTYPSASGTFARGGHGLFSTAVDYLRFAQMLLDRGESRGRRFLAPETVDLMHANRLPRALLPFDLGGLKMEGYGFGFGSQVLLDVEASGLPGSVGEYGWGGAAKTQYWVDPRHGMIFIILAQYMAGFDYPELKFKSLVYQALIEQMDNFS